jgi:hypothetical protein
MVMPVLVVRVVFHGAAAAAGGDDSIHRLFWRCVCISVQDATDNNNNRIYMSISLVIITISIIIVIIHSYSCRNSIILQNTCIATISHTPAHLGTAGHMPCYVTGARRPGAVAALRYTTSRLITHRDGMALGLGQHVYAGILSRDLLLSRLGLFDMAASSLIGYALVLFMFLFGRRE